ncbi:MAG: glycosyltransferase [Actinobacteria bacterium]|nr:MAG: glycosyltransferase [Actinomycetota bacterium]
MREPVVSVVVPTRDRPERLERLLISLAAQSLGGEAFEIVVVDEASGPATAAVLDRHATGTGTGAGAGAGGHDDAPRAAATAAAGSAPSVRVLRHPVALGPGAARNAGWRRARAALVAFTDDDCRAHPDWLRAGVEAHRGDPGAIVQGRTEPDPGELPAGLLSRTVRIERLGPQYETCNIFYPRALLERLGGFDEGFGLRPGGEDTDLAWRALESGARAVHAPGALVYHAVERLGIGGRLREATRWTATVRIFAEHPGTRAMLTRRVFWNVWHYLLVRSLLALALPPAPRRVLITRHAIALRRRAREAGAGPWAIPFLVLCDAIELGALIRGGLRYRTLVL